jgi:mono/diheme cytochrome c family protein
MRTTLAASIVLAVCISGSFAAAEASGSEPVTFNKHVAPIVFEQCAACHRPGEVAPFSLLTYEDVRKRAKQIAVMTADRLMPPWKSVEGHGQFVDERRLSGEQIELIARWVEQGAVEGAAADLPAAPVFSDGWKLGEPDLVVTMPEPYEVPAEGPDIYRNFVFSLAVPEGKYIKAVEYRPGNRRVVHHAALALDTAGIARRQDEADPAPGFKGGLNIPGRLFPGSLAAWTPGRDPMPLPEGFSLPWEKGADLILQLHLHPSGKPETDQSSVGFYFTDQPPRRSMADLVLIDQKIDIPPGERAYRTRDELTLPIDVEAFGVFPHMHLIGRELKLTARPPEGDPISLLWINDWDFNWQNFYQYAEPVKLPAGTRLLMEALHDNSAENFRNPSNPPIRVTWGEETTNEMSVAILQLVPVNESDLPKLHQALGRRILGGFSAGGGNPRAAAGKAPSPDNVLERFDKNQDGKLDLDELAAAAGQPKALIEQLFKLFDRNGDGALDASELAAALSAFAK